MLVLDQIAQRLAQARRDQIRRVAQKYRRAGAGFRVLPCPLSQVSKVMQRSCRQLDPAKLFRIPSARVSSDGSIFSAALEPAAVGENNSPCR
jgi:hypothetical protein